MVSDSHEFQTLDQLREFVNLTLCENDQLHPGAFPMTERILMRGGKPCGMSFCVHGPRSLKIAAIWETESNCLLFYGASGERFAKVSLRRSPQLHAA